MQKINRTKENPVQRGLLKVQRGLLRKIDLYEEEEKLLSI